MAVISKILLLAYQRSDHALNLTYDATLDYRCKRQRLKCQVKFNSMQANISCRSNLFLEQTEMSRAHRTSSCHKTQRQRMTCTEVKLEAQLSRDVIGLWMSLVWSE